MTKTIHFLFLSHKKEKLYQSLCNRLFSDKSRVTDDSTEITCQKCLESYLANQKRQEQDDEGS